MNYAGNCHVFQSPPRFSLPRAGGARARSTFYEISLAKAKAAAAAKPPIAMVCNALRPGPVPV
jgi:hypothetical protein